jgi:hypothetical protein
LDKLKHKFYTPKRASESAWCTVQIGEDKKDCIFFRTKHCTAGLSINRPGGIKRNITATIMAQPVGYLAKHRDNQFIILTTGEQKRGATAYNIEIENSLSVITLFKQYIQEELRLRGTPYTQHHSRGRVAAPPAPRGLILQSYPQVPQQTAATAASEGTYKALSESPAPPHTLLGNFAAQLAPQDRNRLFKELLTYPFEERTLQTALHVLGEDSGASSAARPPTKDPAVPMALQGHNQQTATASFKGDYSGAPSAARPNTKRSEGMLDLPNTAQARKGEVSQQTDRVSGEEENDEGSIFVMPFSLWKYSPPTNALFSQPKKGKERKEEEYKQTKLGITNEPQRVVGEPNARDIFEKTKHHNKTPTQQK